MFYLTDKTEDLSPGHSLSDNSEGLLWRGKGGVRIYNGFATRIRNIKNIYTYIQYVYKIYIQVQINIYK